MNDIIPLWFCCRFVFPSEWGTASGSDCSIGVKNEPGPEKCAYKEPRYKMTLKEMDFFNLQRPRLRRDLTNGYKITKCIDWED